MEERFSRFCDETSQNLFPKGEKLENYSALQNRCMAETFAEKKTLDEFCDYFSANYFEKIDICFSDYFRGFLIREIDFKNQIKKPNEYETKAALMDAISLLKERYIRSIVLSYKALVSADPWLEYDFYMSTTRFNGQKESFD